MPDPNGKGFASRPLCGGGTRDSLQQFSGRDLHVSDLIMQGNRWPGANVKPRMPDVRVERRVKSRLSTRTCAATVHDMAAPTAFRTGIPVGSKFSRQCTLMPKWSGVTRLRWNG
jgi:hypothetical protein